MSTNSKPQLFHCLRYRDADRAIEFLKAIGFTERLLVRDEADPSLVMHAQFQWRDNGGLMFGSVRPGDDDKRFTPGTAVCNLVVEHDVDVDTLVHRAVDAGATLVIGPGENPYGGRAAGVRDFEGNFWNFDSYKGA